MTHAQAGTSPQSGTTRRVVRSGVVQLIGSFGEFGALLASGIAMAHLLGPEEFGLFAMVTSLTAIVDTFGDLGLNYATVQRRGLSQVQLSSLFWISARFNAAVFALMVMAGPFLAWFYRQPQLTYMTGVVAIAALFRGLATQHESQMMRDMRFGRLKAIELTSVVVGAAAGVVLALLGAKAWALVLQVVITGAMRAIGLWICSNWKPLPHRDSRAEMESVRPMLKYGTNFSIYRLLMYGGRQLDRVLLGRVAGPTTLGFYANAARWSIYPADMLSNPLTGVAVAGLTEVGVATPAYRESIRRAITPFFAVLVPGVAFAMLQSETLVVKILGDKWAPSAPLFRILCVGTLMLGLERVGKWIYLSTGDTHRQLRWALVFTPVVAIGVITGLPYGPIGVASGYAAATAALALPGLAYCLKSTNVRLSDVLGALVLPVLSSAVAAAATYSIRGIGVSGIMELMVRGVIFAAVYAATWAILPGGRSAIRDMLRLTHALRPESTSASPRSGNSV